MKHLLVLATVSSMIWLLSVLARSSGLSSAWLLLAYVSSHLAFIAVPYFALQSVALESVAYAQIYHLASCFPMGFASLIALRYSFAHGRAIGILVVITLFISSAVVSWVLERDVVSVFHFAHLPSVIRWHFILAAVFTSCGVATFLSLAIQTGNEDCAVKLALSVFWTVFGVYTFAYAIGRLNPYLGWAVRQTWVPTIATLLCFTWLGWKLSSGQKELSRQALPAIVDAEYVVIEPDFEA